MWFHHRIGPNTGVSTPGCLGLFGVFALIGLAGQALAALWPLLVGAVVLYAAYLAWRAVQHRDHAEQASDGCMFCHNEVINLQRREQAELEMQQARQRALVQRAEAERLRAKYRKQSPPTGS